MKKTITKVSKKTFTLKTQIRLAWSGLVFFTGIFQQALFAQSYTFVTGGATGINGPTQVQLDAAYAATNLSSAVVSAGGIQTWTVPVTGLYQLVANGAQGGGVTGNGGLGASINGRVSLTAGQVLQIVVGQRGTDASGGSVSNGGGGGGGSFVAVGSNTLLVAAGGGGGAGSFSSDGGPGVTTTDGTSVYNAGGGTNGNGGQSGQVNGDAAGGGGFFTDGLNTTNTAQVANGGLAFVNGATGGMSGGQGIYYGGDGGFGGGGAGWDNSLSRSGGGGGYSGGQGGTFNTNDGAGGGGGSFNAGTDQVNTQGVQTGDGQVVITYLYFVTISQTNTINCHGNSTAALSTDITGGTSPYTYTWSPSGGNGSTATGLAAGVYTVFVTDANAMLATSTYTVTEPDALVASSTAGTILCNGGVTTVTVTETGGTSPFTNDGVMTNLAAGSYTYTVTDANSCASTTTITITEPDVLVASSTAGTILCNGGVTTVTVTEMGGTSPFTGDGVINNIAAGSYTYTVTDDNNCTSTTTITIGEPNLLVASSTAGTILCNGGVTTVTVTETGGTSPFTNDGVINNVAAGSYTYTVTDANACASTTTITINEPSAITKTQSFTVCAGGSVTVGATTYTTTGSYTNVLTSATGCDSTVTTNLTVNQLPSVSFTGFVDSVCVNTTYTLTGGAPAGGSYTGAGVSATNFSVTTTGTYTITYTYIDANTCSATATHTVATKACTVTGIASVDNRNGFNVYPNPASEAIFIQADAIIENATIEVYDMIGRKVVNEKMNDKLNRISLQNFANGVYYIKIISNNTIQFEQKIIRAE